jgi:LAO/AO transport system ATPase
MAVSSIEKLLQRFQHKDRQALARLLTLVARGEQLESIRDAVIADMADRSVVAFTGSAGVGKSSLIGRVINLLRGRERTVAVLACDPQSSITGGALLGDRLRMSGNEVDAGVFIRSVAAEGGHQAVAPNVELMIRLLAAFGFDFVILETVGAGQGDVAVRSLVDVLVLLLQPEAGDDLQWEKAGLLEVADIVVIHKSDLPGAANVEAQVRSQLNMPGCREVPVLSAGALKGEGLEALLDAVERQLEVRNAERGTRS